MTAAAVSAIGRNRTAPASTTASSSGIPSLHPQLDEVDQDDRVANDDAGAGDEADHRRRGEERAEHRVRRQDARRARTGSASMMVSGVDERLEPADDQDVDEHQHGGERDAEIAEHLVGDVPLAIPLHRVARAVERLPGVEDLEAVALRAAARWPAPRSSAGWRRPGSRSRRRRRRSRRSPAAGSCGRGSAPRAPPSRLVRSRQPRRGCAAQPQAPHGVERATASRGSRSTIGTAPGHCGSCSRPAALPRPAICTTAASCAAETPAAARLLGVQRQLPVRPLGLHVPVDVDDAGRLARTRP